MDSIVNYINEHLVISIIVGSLLVFSIYSVFAVLLNKIYSAKYGKTTIIAWIPVLNIYLLGKLVIHSVFGLLLVIGFIFGICISFKIPYLESINLVMPKDYVLPYQISYGVIILLLVIIGKIKLNSMIRRGEVKSNNDIILNREYENKELGDLISNHVDEPQQMINDDFSYNLNPPTINKDDNLKHDNSDQNP